MIDESTWFPIRIPRSAILLAAVLFAGCASAPHNSAQQGHQSAGHVPPAKPPRPLPELELSEELLYQVMVAEFAERGGINHLAAHGYLTAAKNSRDPRLAEKATRSAIHAKDQGRALQGALLWVELEPEHQEARRTLLTLLVISGQLEQATPYLQTLLNPTDPNYTANLSIAVQILAKSSKAEQSLALFDRVTEGQSQRGEVIYAGAKLAHRLKLLEQALARLDTLLEQEFHEPGVLLKVKLLTVFQEKKEALQLTRDYLEEHSDSVPLRLSYSRQLVNLRRFEEALTEFRTLATNSPEDPDIRYGLGILALQRGLLNEATAQFLKLLELKQRENESRYTLGRIAEQRGEIDAAIDWYRTVKISPQHFEAHYQAAILIGHRDGLDAAIEYIRSIEKPHGRDILRFLIAEGNLFQEFDQPQNAYDSFTKALELSPTEPMVLYARAMVAEELDRIDLLELDLGKILESDPNHTQALNALGYTLADRTDRLEEALDYVSRAYELEGDSPAIMDSMGWVLYRLERYEEALPYLQRAADKLDDGEIYAHLIEVLWVMGQKQKARQAWDRVLKFAPGHPDLRQVEHYFR